LRGEEEWVLSDIRTMSPLVVRGVRCGVVLEDSSGERLQLDWTGLVRFGRILAGLQQVRREASSTT
jgi:acyl-homoserine lactone acylase PvdQ